MRHREELNENTIFINPRNNEVRKFSALLRRKGLIKSIHIEYEYITKYWLFNVTKTATVIISDDNMTLHYFKDTKSIGITFSSHDEFKKIKKYPVESSLTKESCLKGEIRYYLKFQQKGLISIYW